MLARGRALCAFFIGVGALSAEPAAAAPATADLPEAPSFEPRLILETARIPAPLPDPEYIRVRINGEYQLRIAGLSSLPLATASGTRDTLGQTTRVYHFLRITPRIQFGRAIELVAQADTPEGMVFGGEPRNVANAAPFDRDFPVHTQPRWLYVTWRTRAGELTVGQQPFHFGLGLIENDGDHPTLFGDYFGGTRVERVSFMSGSSSTPFRMGIAGDLVFEDAEAKLSADEIALQGSVVAGYRAAPGSSFAVLGLYRTQRTSRRLASGADVDRTKNTLLIDATGEWTSALAGTPGFVFGAYELAYRFGTEHANAAFLGAENAHVDSFGGIARIGAVLTANAANAPRRFGALVAMLEWGYASGDSNPLDDRERGFRFDPNYKVGQLLFHEVVRWKAARSQSMAADPTFSAGGLAAPDRAASSGGVAGASYLAPTLLVRPTPELDLVFGSVVAQTTADFVDPTRLALFGRYENYDAGDPRAHDLGLELDLAVARRFLLEGPMAFELGAQGALLFPGHAFDDAGGHGIGHPYYGVLRAGLQY